MNYEKDDCLMIFWGAKNKQRGGVRLNSETPLKS